MAGEGDDFGVAGAPPRAPTTTFTVVEDPPGPPRRATHAVTALVLGGAAWVLMLLVLAGGPLFWAASLVVAGLAIAYGTRGLRAIQRSRGALLGRGLAIAGIVLALVHLGAFLVLPLLLVLLCCMSASFDGPGSSAPPQSGSGSGGGCACPDCGACCEACACPDCGCGNCGCADCGCGDCGDCGCGDCGCGDCGDCGCGDCGDCGCGDCGDCGCGGCACATLALPGVAGACGHAPPGLAAADARARLDRLFAHHPRGDAFAQDVFVLWGVRLCVGCFTTYPAFLAATGALLLLGAGGAAPAWGASLAAGTLLAAAQGVSSAGLARRRPVKVAVKLALGVGLALVLHGVRDSPWPEAVQATLLLGTLALAALSAVPRMRRMRQARGACACQAPQAAR